MIAIGDQLAYCTARYELDWGGEELHYMEKKKMGLRRMYA
mgnify:CR=1 FL=1